MAHNKSKIPRATLKRLPLYYRFVNTLKSKGIDRVNSKAISEALNIESATIRRDFSYFGELGKKATVTIQIVYQNSFKTALSDSDNIHIALVGVGNLGRALLTYNFSIHDEMTITEAFDIDEQIVGTEIGDVSVHHMNDLKKVLNAQNINVVILTTPEEAAQRVANQLVEADIQGILNFTPARIEIPNTVQVHHIDLGIELQSLLFFMKNYSN